MRLLLKCFLLLPNLLFAQLTMDDFLQSAWESSAISVLDSQNDFLDSNPYKLSPISSMEFRTESNQLDIERQDYAIRLKPANPWEVKRNKAYFQTYKQTLQLDRQRELRKILKTHYETIVNWAYLDELRKLKEEESELVTTSIEILEAQRFSDFFDASDYAELKIDQIEQLVQLEELHFGADAQRSKIEKLCAQARNQTISWTLSDFISIEEIHHLIEDQPSAMGVGEVAYRQKKVELAQSEWALEKSNINVGYLQAQYQEYRIEQDRKPWSIGVGIAIPIFNPNKGDMTKRKLEIIEAEGDLLDAKNEQQEGIAQIKKKLETLSNRYYHLQSRLDSLDLPSLTSSLQKIESSNPITAVKLKGSLIKSGNTVARLKREIYMAYIDYLWHSELLQEQPFKNYLDPGLN